MFSLGAPAKLERLIYDASDKQPAMLKVFDRIQIPSITTLKDTGTKENASYYLANTA